MNTRHVALALSVWLATAGLARADDIAGGEVEIAPAEPGPALTGATPEPIGYPAPDIDSVFVPAEKDWAERTSWRYGSDRIFQLTRDVRRDDSMPRGLLYVVAVPFDLVTLPVAAIAGLYGR